MDNATRRLIAVGRYGGQLIMVPYESEQDVIRPVTVHVAARAQVEARIKSGRFSHE